jgi:hypothetical protein
MAQICISDPHRPQVIIDHCPIPDARGKPHRECSQLSTSYIDLDCCNTTAT